MIPMRMKVSHYIGDPVTFNHLLIMSPASLRLFLLAFVLSALLSGCGAGTRFIFSTSHEVQATPGHLGLSYEEVWFPATDGTRLHGWMIPGDQGRPLVLFFHGNAANISHRVENLAHLHGMGFPVFIFDYRGFGRSEGRPLREADLWRDARGALAWLAGRGWPPEQMIYFGRSMGAAIAVRMALESAPAGLVLEAPFTSLADIARRLTPVTYALVGWWSIDARFDNIGQIANISAPLLMFHGTGDAVVPPEMSQRLFLRAREPKTLHLVKGAGHSDAYAAGGEDYRQAWLQFSASLFPQHHP
jgi:uncharacterized protein